MRPRAGMTLVELTVALTVGAAALALGGMVFATLADRRAALVADAEHAERSLNARRMLTAWFAEAANTQFAEQLVAVRGMQRTASGPLADDTVTFVTTAGTMRRMQLFIDRRRERPALIALSRNAEDVETMTVLASDVAGFEAKFLTTAFGRREWRRGWARTGLLPEAITFRLSAADGTQLPAALAGDITIPLAGAQ